MALARSAGLEISGFGERGERFVAPTAGCSSLCWGGNAWPRPAGQARAQVPFWLVSPIARSRRRFGATHAWIVLVGIALAYAGARRTRTRA